MGRFIVVEGIEGSGKTTIVSQIVNTLKMWGVKDVIITREPGGTPVAEILRSVIKSGQDGDIGSITDYAELLIFYAARIQLLENVIKPALLKGTWVVGDRHEFSSFAYQGGGRGINKSFIKYLSKVLLNNFYPDIIFYLDVSIEIGFSRLRKRKELDYIERESIDFFNRVRSTYQLLVKENLNVITIDATQSLAKVNYDVNRYLKKLLNF